MYYLPAIRTLLTWGLSFFSVTLWAGEVVGHVTLVIGNAQLERAGQKLSISKASDIQAGDRVETAANGQVMIRFVDNAKVSVRPASVLRIQDYHYDALSPEQSVVRFELEQGTVRAISGEAAHRARDRFRLNTPLVAIGVRGTDFTAQVGEESTAVVVNQGAIRLAPLGSGCSASALGACGGPRAKTLTASMIGMALVYRVNMTEPSFQPLNGLKGHDQLVPVLHQDGDAVNGAEEIVADSKGPASVTNILPLSSALVWGRWSSVGRPGEGLTVPFQNALKGNQVTVGDGYYVLFRSPLTPNLLSQANGQAQFVLQSATANYLAVDKTVLPAQVQSGTLGIDFTYHTFSTTVNLFSSSTGAQTLQASGSVNPTTGILVGGGPGSHVAGALSLDTLQAGYLFNKSLANGAILSGATLWGR